MTVKDSATNAACATSCNWKVEAYYDDGTTEKLQRVLWLWEPRRPGRGLWDTLHRVASLSGRDHGTEGFGDTGESV